MVFIIDEISVRYLCEHVYVLFVQAEGIEEERTQSHYICPQGKL